MLFPQFDKSRHRNIENIVAVVLLKAFNLFTSGQAFRTLELAQLRLFICIQSEGQRSESAFLLRVYETSFLEQEGSPSLRPFLLAYYLANIWRSRICHWYDFDEFGFVYGFGSLRRKGSIEVDVPLGHQPCK